MTVQEIEEMKRTNDPRLASGSQEYRISNENSFNIIHLEETPDPGDDPNDKYTTDHRIKRIWDTTPFNENYEDCPVINRTDNLKQAESKVFPDLVNKEYDYFRALWFQSYLPKGRVINRAGEPYELKKDWGLLFAYAVFFTYDYSESETKRQPGVLGRTGSDRYMIMVEVDGFGNRVIAESNLCMEAAEEKAYEQVLRMYNCPEHDFDFDHESKTHSCKKCGYVAMNLQENYLTENRILCEYWQDEKIHEKDMTLQVEHYKYRTEEFEELIACTLYGMLDGDSEYMKDITLTPEEGKILFRDFAKFLILVIV